MANNYISINSKLRRAKVGKSQDQTNLKRRQAKAKERDPSIVHELQWERASLEEATYIESEFLKIVRKRGKVARMPHHKPGKGNEGKHGDWFYMWDGCLQLMNILPSKYTKQNDFFHLFRE